jgi:hypothetical protein
LRCSSNRLRIQAARASARAPPSTILSQIPLSSGACAAPPSLPHPPPPPPRGDPVVRNISSEMHDDAPSLMPGSATGVASLRRHIGWPIHPPRRHPPGLCFFPACLSLFHSPLLFRSAAVSARLCLLASLFFTRLCFSARLCLLVSRSPLCSFPLAALFTPALSQYLE